MRGIEIVTVLFLQVSAIKQSTFQHQLILTLINCFGSIKFQKKKITPTFISFLKHSGSLSETMLCFQKLTLIT